MARVLLYQFNRPLEVILPVQIREQLFVSHRLQAVQGTFRIYRLCFFQQSRRHHLLHAFVYARVQFCARAVESYLHDAERTLFGGMGTQGAVGFSRHTAQLHTMRQSRRVLLVHFRPIVRIQTLHFALQPRQSFVLVFALHARAYRRRNRRQVIQAFAHRIGV